MTRSEWEIDRFRLACHRWLDGAVLRLLGWAWETWLSCVCKRNASVPTSRRLLTTAKHPIDFRGRGFVLMRKKQPPRNNGEGFFEQQRRE